MSAERSLIERLLHRRVPQIVGMYVAATWLVIEIGDWVTTRFNLPPSITSYVFVSMLVLLPAVILFAYNHGAPGQDSWTKLEKMFIPLNVLVACGVLYFVSPQLQVEAATQTVQIPDESGVVQEFVVAREGHHKDVISFFWKNESGDSDLDWLSYGLVMMLAHDMNRVSPVISVATPFESSVAKKEFIEKEHHSFLDEPQALQVQIARDRRSAALIVGSFSQVDNVRSIEATVIDAESGAVIGTHTVSGADWLAAVDDVSAALLAFLEIEPGPNQSDDPLDQHFSASMEAIQHFTNGTVALALQNDFPMGISEFQKAVEIDDDFAEASGQLARVHYLTGDVESARIAVNQALENSYRLSEKSKFLLKSNRYAFDGDYSRGERVLEMWTEVQPNSTDAFTYLAQLSKLRGGEDGLATASAAYDRLLELKPEDYGLYREKAAVEQQRGDYAAAARYLRTFLEYVPDSSVAHIQLANIYQAQGDLDAAQESLEDAAILSDDPLSSELGLARLEARRGLYEQAEQRVARQLTDKLSPQQRMSVLSAQIELSLVTGQIGNALRLIDDVDVVAAGLMPPMIRLVSIQNQKTSMLLMQGDAADALALADEIVAQLQPPLDSYLNFSYTTIFGETNDRDAFRERADKARALRAQLPEFFQAFVELNSATISIWDEDFAVAVDHLDQAQQILEQSLLQVMQDNLSIAGMQVKLADLYLQAEAIEKYQAHIDAVLKVFPAHAEAKLTQAKGYIFTGDNDAARQSLAEALDIWSRADAGYIRLVEAQELQASL